MPETAVEGKRWVREGECRMCGECCQGFTLGNAERDLKVLWALMDRVGQEFPPFRFRGLRACNPFSGTRLHPAYWVLVYDCANLGPPEQVDGRVIRRCLIQDAKPWPCTDYPSTWLHVHAETPNGCGFSFRATECDVLEKAP